MKKHLTSLFLFLFLGSAGVAIATNPPIYIAFQWHMHQPIYQPGETVVQSQNSGIFSYNLYDIFNSRSGPYTSWPSNAVNKMLTMPHGGAQVSFSGSLVENLNTMEANEKGFSNWKSSWNSMTSKKTSLGNQRLDMVAFGYHHPLMPLIDNTDIRKQIQRHKAVFAANFPGMPYSKGIFPPENAFETHIIPALIAEGIEWVMVDNQHFDRACAGQPWAKASSVVEPNKADQVNPNPNDWKQLNGLWAPIPVSAGFGHRPHWVKYVDPSTGTEYRMIAVPTSTFFGNEDGRGGFGALNYENTISQLESYNTDPSHPILVVLHHDGDNFGGGTDSYYGSNFDNFVNWINSNPSRFVCTTIQDYLQQFPPAANDVIHVEAGSWSGAGSDPEFLKWNGNPVDGYSPDRNSWSVITATSNIVKTAEQIDAAATDTKVAWDYLTVGETSCYWYWDGTQDWDNKPTRASNMATARAINVVNSGADVTPPSIYHPQREPYNPGAKEWTVTQPSDFTVWSYVFDVSGLQSVKLKYRTDKDGVNPLTNNDNETYAGGESVNAWQEIPMTGKAIAISNNTLQPAYKAEEYSAQITGLNNVLVDYYMEATDKKGNTARSEIFHVWVGDASHSSGNVSTQTGTYIVTPLNPTTNDIITVELPSNTSGGVLHWGVNKFEKPNAAYLPAGSTYWTDNVAVRTPFVLEEGKYRAKIGPFNNPAQTAQYISFVVNYTGNNTWDNNSGTDYKIALQNPATTLSKAGLPSVILYPNPATDKIFIQSAQTIKEIELLSLCGAVLKKVRNSYSLELKDQPKGAYLLRITFENNAQRTEKIIKKG